MAHVAPAKRHSVQEVFKSGNWGSDLAAQALAVAQKTGKTPDWITWIDACHATQGIVDDDILLLHDACTVEQLQCSALKWRLENFMSALNCRLPETREALSDDQLISQLCLDQSPANRCRQKLGLRALGSQLGDYPTLLARIESLAIKTLKKETSRSATSSLRLINSASAIQRKRQSFASSVNRLLAEKTPMDGACKVAVVGNAPSLLNNEHGAEIDTCDIVVRFNRTSAGEKTSIHTGSRTDIWVMSPSTSVQCRPIDAHTVVVSGAQPFLRPSRYWTTLSEITTLGEFPTSVWYSLVRQLQAPPSAGLLALCTLRSMHTDLEIKRFGFTEAHGLHGIQKNHHADQVAVSSRHNWAREVQWIQDNC